MIKLTHLVSWLQNLQWFEEKAPGGSIAWVADGDWDFDKMHLVRIDSENRKGSMMRLRFA